MLSSLIRERVLGDKWVSEEWTLLLDIFALFFGNHVNHFVFDHSSLSCFSSVAFCIPQNINLLVGVVCVVACVVLCNVRESFRSSQSLQIQIWHLKVSELMSGYPGAAGVGLYELWQKAGSGPLPTHQCLCCSKCWAGVRACVGNCTTFPFGWLAVHLKPNDKEETPMDGRIISRDFIIVKWKMSWLSLHIWHDIPGHWGDFLWMCKELCIFFFF